MYLHHIEKKMYRKKIHADVRIKNIIMNNNHKNYKKVFLLEEDRDLIENNQYTELKHYC